MKSGHASKNEHNVKIAEAIEAQGGVESVGTLLVHHNPHTMNIFVHERVDPQAKQWKPIALLEFDQEVMEKL